MKKDAAWAATPSSFGVMKTCLCQDCKEKAFARGLCQKHYRKAYNRIKTRKTTWEDLEKEGKALPADYVKT